MPKKKNSCTQTLDQRRRARTPGALQGENGGGPGGEGLETHGGGSPAKGAGHWDRAWPPAIDDLPHTDPDADEMIAKLVVKRLVEHGMRRIFWH